jgi:hypothetical protein
MGNAQTLEERIFKPEEVKVTYIHSDDNNNYISTKAWPDDIVTKKEFDKIKSIVVVYDTETASYYVYDGNKRVRHAKDNSYTVKAQVINSPEDFSVFLKTGTICWFGVRNYSKLMELMRIYSQYPNENEGMPEELYAKIRPLAEAQARRHREQIEAQQNELFPFDDDD